MLISSTLNLTAVGSSLARITCETSRVLLAGGRWFFSGISSFRPTKLLTQVKMSERIFYQKIRTFLIISLIGLERTTSASDLLQL